MKLIKKTIVLVGDLSKGYVSVVRVRDETGIKVVGEDFTTNYRAIVKINKEREIFSLLGKKTEIGTKIKVESTDEIGCVVCDGEKIVASGGKGISQQEIKFLMCPPTHPQIEIDKREQEINTEIVTPIENIENDTVTVTSVQKDMEEKDEDLEKNQLFEKLSEKKHDFYFGISEKVDEMFVIYPKEQTLNDVIPESEWIRVNYCENEYYVVGRLYENKKVRYLGYGVPGYENVVPPKIAENVAQWLPIKNNGYDGFWLFFQNADNGKIELQRID